MGFAASQARLLGLVQRRQDLEFQLQLISQARMQLSGSTLPLLMAGANLTPGTPEAQRLQSIQAVVNAYEQRYVILAENLDKQLQAINTEIDAVRKVISNNIQSTFKLNGQA